MCAADDSFRVIVDGISWQLPLIATDRGGEVMSGHLNETALEHTHAAAAEVYPQGFAFPSQTESLSVRAAHLEIVHAAVPHVDAEHVAVEVPLLSCLRHLPNHATQR